MRASARTSMRQDDDDLRQELWYAWVHSSLTPQQTASSLDSTLQTASKLTINVSAIDISINCYVLTSHQKCPSLPHIAP